jgi:hypothetical protein
MDTTNHPKEMSLWRQATALMSVPSVAVEEIAARAYSKHVNSEKSPVEIWLEAERELMREKALRA